MTERRDEKADPCYDLISRDAAFPYDFRKKTGLVLELHIISARTLEILGGMFGAELVLRSGIEALSLAQKKVISLKARVKNSRQGTALLNGDLTPLFALLVIHYYTALEAGIEDLLLGAIRFRPNLVSHLSNLGVTKLPDEQARDLTLVEAEHVLKRLRLRTSEICKKAGESAPQGWLRQPAAVGLALSVPSEHCFSIREMVYVRNCIAHQAGRTNKDCVGEMSILTAKEGELIRITTQAMSAYISACMAMADELVRVAQLPSPFLSAGD